ncbi:predicted protein [Lichtheimia corymbifera JMRC:FSU:9682]|uniref:Chitin-binding type-2 domain-containing protein n=1 Tax=Lichtheimia corymbifera JMRC:FSU:9682 TaxID=1263082 RepID=A0A068RGV7_9FUNG|nr:predicted protein [Lichtheimia corymbifera JMRC:FSU:9682]
MVIKGRHFSLLLALATLLLLMIPSTNAQEPLGAAKSKQDAMESCKDPAKANIPLYLYQNAESFDVYYSCKEQQEKVAKFGRARSCDTNKDRGTRHPAPFTKVVDGKKYPGLYYQCDHLGRTHLTYCNKPKKRNPYQIKGCRTWGPEM